MLDERVAFKLIVLGSQGIKINYRAKVSENQAC